MSTRSRNRRRSASRVFSASVGVMLVVRAVVVLALISIACVAPAWSSTSDAEKSVINKQLDEVTKYLESGGMLDDSTSDPVPSDDNATSANATQSATTLANVVDEAVDKEFSEGQEEMEGQSGRNYNETLLENKEAKEETVIRITHGGGQSSSSSSSSNNTSKEGEVQGTQSEVAEELVDKQNNEYVLANPNTGNLELQLDPLLLQDLTLMFVTASVLGMVLEAWNFSPIAGYVLSGSMLGPGGFGWLHRLVQIETVSQLGVYMLLFVLGLEFSLDKLKGVQMVTLLGGSVEVILMSLATGLIAFLTGGATKEGILVGATLGMSSTSIVLKGLQPYNDSGLFKRITTGTLLLQDCLVGLLFALVPAFASGGTQSSNAAFLYFAELVAVMVVFILGCMAMSSFIMPAVMGWIERVCSAEIYRLFAVAFCFSIATLGDLSGVSSELGAFCAGAIMGGASRSHGTRVHQEVNQLEAVFVALFLSSIGIIMSPRFLAEHALFLGGTFLVIVCLKLIIFSAVVKGFGYNFMTSLAVGFSLIPISEFAFVIFSSSFKANIIKKHWYMLLLGVTGLSMFVSPFINQVLKPLVSHPANSGSFDLEMSGSVMTVKSHRSYCEGDYDDSHDDDERGALSPARAVTNVVARRPSANQF